MKRHLSLIIVALGAILSCGNAADLSGKIILKGTPPPELDLEKELDPQCSAIHTKPAKTRFYIVDANGGLADVVVYVKSGVPAGQYKPPQEALTIDQKGCEFNPYISAAMVGQEIKFLNSDPILHNVNHTGSDDLQKRPPNIAQLPKAAPISRAFGKQEQLFVKVKCDVHRWMFAFIAIFDHPFFAVSGKDGSYKISNLPPGKYTIEAIHRKAGKVSREIEITDAPATLDLTLEIK